MGLGEGTKGERSAQSVSSPELLISFEHPAARTRVPVVADYKQTIPDGPRESTSLKKNPNLKLCHERSDLNVTHFRVLRTAFVRTLHTYSQ